MKHSTTISIFLAGLFLISCRNCLAEDIATLTSADGLLTAYLYSFGYDKCGDYLLGKRYREAIFAKLESCPFTEDAKLDFYKQVSLMSNVALAGCSAFYAKDSQREPSESNGEHCASPLRLKAVDLLRSNLAKADAGEIKLSDVIVSEKDHFGERAPCEELTKSGME